MIELATFDADTIDRNYDSRKMRDILTRAVTDTLVKNEDAPNKTGNKIPGLKPEVGIDGIPRLHNPFLRLVNKEINSTSKITSLENLTVGSVLVFQDESTRTRYWRIDETDASI